MRLRSRQHDRVVVTLIVVLWIAANFGCGGGGKPVSQNPVPTMASISPASVTAGGAAFSLTVSGVNFTGTSVVKWNGSPRTTAFVSSTQISAAISAADIATAGTVQVTVTTPGPGGGTSTAAVFNINIATNPIPIVSGISPTSATAGSPAFTLTVNGTNFISSSVVQWNGAAQPTSIVSSTQVTAQIPATNIVSAGTANVTVTNPAPGGGVSNTVTFTINPPSQNIGIVQLLSVATNGAPGNGQSIDPAISADGTYVAFDSAASDLVLGDTNVNHDVFLRTTCLQPGAPQPCTPVTEIASLTPNGSQLANGGGATETGAYMSSDGRFVAFEGRLGDVIVNPPINANTQEIFLRDTCKGQPVGCTPATSLVSLTDTGAPVDTANTGAISGNGRVVVFFSSAAGVVTGGTSGGELYARDTCFGAPAVPACTPTTILVSASTSGIKANTTSQTAGPSLSNDGRYVAFFSDATNLVPGDTNNRLDVFLRDTCIGAPAGCAPQTILVSANLTGGAGTGGLNGSFVPSLSGSGRFVMFQSDATDLVATNNHGVFQIYLRDTCTGAAGACTPNTMLVSADSNGLALTNPSTLFGQGNISSTGRYLLFGPGTPLNPGDLVGQAYVRDTCFGAPSGCTPRSNLISVDAQGNQFVGGVRPMAISGDGRFAVLFDGTKQLYLALTGF